MSLPAPRFSTFALVLPLCATQGAESAPASPDRAAMLAIRASDLKADLTFLASDELEGRATPSVGQAKAAAYLGKRFAEIGLEPGGDGGTYLQSVSVPPRRSRRSADTASAPAAGEAHNVIGILRGADVKSGAIVFSAHYDHLGRGMPDESGDGIYNGADDDASGTVSVVALARAFATRKERPARTLVFACFTGEEVGGLGARTYVQRPAVPLAETVCNINLEMLGRTHDIGPRRSWLTGWEYSTLGPILADGAKGADVEVFPDPYPQQDFYLRSDNVQFVRNGVIGQTLSAGSTHPDYHTPKDESDRIDYGNLESLVRGIYLGAARIASGAETPKPTGPTLAPQPGRRAAPPASKPAAR